MIFQVQSPSFAELRDRLDVLDFFLVSEAELPPLVEGEPELAHFVWRPLEVELVYSFNPVTWQRGLALHGEHADLAAARLRQGLELTAPLPLDLTRAILQALAEAVPSSAWAGLDLPSRRQVLRWILQDGLDGDQVEEVVRLALSDPDGELRVTAMLAVARLELLELGLEVRRCALPSGRLSAGERSVVRAVQRATLEILNGVPAGVGAWAELRAAVEGKGQGAISDYLRALTEPLVQEDGILQHHGGIAFLPIPGVSHAVGVLDLARGVGLQAHTPPPFLLAQGPLTRAQVGLRSDPDQLWRGTAREARTICLELGLSLPTALQWECGLRGPDGRRWPWGMEGAARPHGRAPWGLVPTAGPEWVVEGAMGLDWALVETEEAMLRPVWPGG